MEAPAGKAFQLKMRLLNVNGIQLGQYGNVEYFLIMLLSFPKVSSKERIFLIISLCFENSCGKLKKQEEEEFSFCNGLKKKLKKLFILFL